MGAIETLGSAIIGGGMGLLTRESNNKNQLEQQDKLNAQQSKWNTVQNAQNVTSQMDLWNKTNYSAQIDQMKKAGLNPALMYAKGGPGGTTQANTVSNAAPQSPKGSGMEITQGIQTAMGLAMMKAQIDNLNADTKLKDTNATFTGGVATNKANVEIESLTQGIQNAKAVEALTKTENAIKALDLEIKGDTVEDQISQIRVQMLKTNKELDQLVLQNWIDQATKNDKIAIVKGELAGILAKNMLTEAQTNVSEQAIKNMQNEITQSLRNFEQNQQKTDAEVSQGRQEIMMKMTQNGLDPNMASKVLEAIGFGVALKTGNKTMH